MPLPGHFLVLFYAFNNDLITAFSICKAFVDAAYCSGACTGLSADLAEYRATVEHPCYLKPCGKIDQFLDGCHIVKEFAALLFIS